MNPTNEVTIKAKKAAKAAARKRQRDTEAEKNPKDEATIKAKKAANSAARKRQRDTEAEKNPKDEATIKAKKAANSAARKRQRDTEAETNPKDEATIKAKKAANSAARKRQRNAKAKMDTLERAALPYRKANYGERERLSKDMCKDAEHNLTAAVALAAINSYTRNDLMTEIEALESEIAQTSSVGESVINEEMKLTQCLDRLAQDILETLPDANHLSETVVDYEKLVFHSKLPACASCGIRSTARDSPMYCRFRISDLDILAYSSSQNEAFGLKNAVEQRIISVWESSGKKRYHLHPELIDILDGPSCMLCSSCSVAIRAHRVPKFSLAGGYDYGVLSRYGATVGNGLSLSQLTLPEKLCIAKYRLYLQVLKLKTSTKGGKTLMGHGITFPHTGPEASFVSSLKPNFDDGCLDTDLGSSIVHGVMSALRVVFLGPRHLHDQMIKSGMVGKALSVRADVIYSILSILRESHRGYYTLNLPDSSSKEMSTFRNTLNDLPGMLLQAANVLSTEEDIKFEATATENPATFEHYGGEDDETVHCDGRINAQDEGTATGCSDVVVEKALTMSHAMVVSRSHLSGVNGTSDAAVAALKAVIPRRHDNLNPTIRVEQSSLDPLNEFSGNAGLLAGVFPHLFPLGFVTKGKGTISDTEMTMMLRQFTNVFAEEERFVFLLFNQLQRHAAAKSVTATLRNRSEVFKDFEELITNDEFLRILDEVVGLGSMDSLSEDQKQKAHDARKQLFAMANPVVLMTGSAIPMSSLERKNHVSKMYAMMQMYGCPTEFLTVALDEQKSTLCIRLASPTRDNQSFPVEEEHLMELLRAHAMNLHGIDLSPTAIKKRIAGNAVATALFFKDVMSILMMDVLKCPGGEDSKKSVPFHERDKGVFGRIYAHFGVIEPNNGGILHTHLLLWSQLNADTISFSAGRPVLENAVLSVIDRKLSAWAPLEHHVAAVLARNKRWLTASDTSLGGTEHPLQRPMLLKGLWTKSSQTEADILHIGSKVAVVANNHEHSFTCLKGKVGCRKCRMGISRPANPSSRILELSSRPSAPTKNGKNRRERDCDIYCEIDKGGYLIEARTVRNPLPSLPRATVQAPIPEPSPRLIVVECKRPFITFDELETAVFDEDGPLCNSAIIPESCQQYLRDVTSRHRAALNGDVNVAGDDAQQSRDRLFIQELCTRNMYLSEYNPVVSACVRSNTNLQILGSVTEAKAAVMYLFRYMTKDTLGATSSFTIMRHSLQHMREYPSKAADNEVKDSRRSVKYFLQNVLNTMNGAAEISAETAAHCVMGGKSFVCSETFQYVSVLPAIEECLANEQACDRNSDDCGGYYNAAVEQWLQDGVFRDPSECQPIANALDDFYPFDGEANVDTMDGNVVNAVNDDGFVDIAQRALGEDETVQNIADVVIGGSEAIQERRGKSGLCSVYRLGDGKWLAVSKEHLYRYRGTELKDLSFEMWHRLISVERIPADADDEMPDKDHKGREENLRFRFANECTLFHTHRQKLLSKHRTPILTGSRPPPHPGRMPMAGSTMKQRQSWKSKADAYAAFMITLFKPWDIDTGSPGKLTWQALFLFVRNLEHADSKEARYTLERIRNISYSSSIKKSAAEMQMQFRSRCADEWRNMPPAYAFLHGQRPVGLDACGNQPDGGAIKEEIIEYEKKYAMALQTLSEPFDYEKAKFKAEADDRVVKLAFANVFDNDDQAYPSSSITQSRHDVFDFQFAHGTSVSEAIRSASRMDGLFDDDDNEGDFKSPVPLSAFKEDQRVCRNSTPAEAMEDVALSDAETRLLGELNEQQREVADTLLLYSSSYDEYRRHGGDDNCSLVLPKPPFLLVQGGPGTGKTHTMNIISHVLRIRARRMGHIDRSSFILPLAPTGATACQLVGGQTIHHGLRLASWGRSRKINDERRQDMQRQLLDVDFILIDEVSMVAASFLHEIDLKLKLIFGNVPKRRDMPFAGLCVVLQGDFFQLPPVKGLSLYQAVLRYHQIDPRFRQSSSSENASLGDSSATSKRVKLSSADMGGAQLLLKYEMRRLTIQQRALGDQQHSAMINRMGSIDRDPSEERLTYDDLRRFKVLSREDMKDETFRSHATIFTTSNSQRARINMERALRFAKDKNVPVFAWKKPIVLSTNILGHSASRETKKRRPIVSNAPVAKRPKTRDGGEFNVHDIEDYGDVGDFDENVSVGSDDGSDRVTGQEYTDILSTDSHLLLEIFVEGAPAFLTENISIDYRLANGSKVTLHSLTFSNSLSVQEKNVLINLIKTAVPGQLTLLNVAPEFVNVSLSRETIGSLFDRWPKGMNIHSSGENKMVVIPVGKAESPSVLTLSKPIRPYWDKKVKAMEMAVQIGFCITYHKGQGATLDGIICDVRNTLMPRFDFNMAYVAFTRVRFSDHIRILSFGGGASGEVDGTSNSHLLKLRPPYPLLLWFSGFEFDTKGNGVWNSDLVRKNAELDLELNQSGRKRATVQRERQKSGIQHSSVSKVSPSFEVQMSLVVGNDQHPRGNVFEGTAFPSTTLNALHTKLLVTLQNLRDTGVTKKFLPLEELMDFDVGLKSLSGTSWLESSVVAAFVLLAGLAEGNQLNHEVFSHVFHPLFVVRLSNTTILNLDDELKMDFCPHFVKTYTQSWNAADFQRRIIIPICLSSHFFLIVMDMRKCNITVYNPVEGRFQQDKAVAELCLQWIGYECQLRNLSFNSTHWVISNATNIPRQQDSYNCGVLVCIIGYCLLNNLPISIATDSASLRRARMIIGQYIVDQVNRLNESPLLHTYPCFVANQLGSFQESGFKIHEEALDADIEDGVFSSVLVPENQGAYDANIDDSDDSTSVPVPEEEGEGVYDVDIGDSDDSSSVLVVVSGGVDALDVDNGTAVADPTSHDIGDSNKIGGNIGEPVRNGRWKRRHKSVSKLTATLTI